MKEKVIWKYAIRIEDDLSIEIPRGGQILSVHNQRGTMCLWVLVNPKHVKEKRYFKIFGTGHRIIEDRIPLLKVFVGSVQFDDLVFHLFECENI